MPLTSWSALPLLLSIIDLSYLSLVFWLGAGWLSVASTGQDPKTMNPTLPIMQLSSVFIIPSLSDNAYTFQTSCPPSWVQIFWTDLKLTSENWEPIRPEGYLDPNTNTFKLRISALSHSLSHLKKLSHENDLSDLNWLQFHSEPLRY